jgi:hypothetical protein
MTTNCEEVWCQKKTYHLLFCSIIAGVQKLLQQISDWKLSSFRHACVPFSLSQNISKPADIPWFFIPYKHHPAAIIIS